MTFSEKEAFIKTKISVGDTFQFFENKKHSKGICVCNMIESKDESMQVYHIIIIKNQLICLEDLDIYNTRMVLVEKSLRKITQNEVHQSYSLMRQSQIFRERMLDNIMSTINKGILGGGGKIDFGSSFFQVLRKDDKK